jgi:hypothetical protein
MSKKFDAESYVSNWDAKIAPIMLVVIVVSVILAFVLNKVTKPDCSTHDYVFCGTVQESHGEEHAAAPAHGGEHGAPAAEHH